LLVWRVAAGSAPERLHADEAEFVWIEPVDEHIDRAHGIVFA
jgi:hypothetical protein